MCTVEKRKKQSQIEREVRTRLDNCRVSTGTKTRPREKRMLGVGNFFFLGLKAAEFCSDFYQPDLWLKNSFSIFSQAQVMPTGIIASLGHSPHFLIISERWKQNTQTRPALPSIFFCRKNKKITRPVTRYQRNAWIFLSLIGSNVDRMNGANPFSCWTIYEVICGWNNSRQLFKGKLLKDTSSICSDAGDSYVRTAWGQACQPCFSHLLPTCVCLHTLGLLNKIVKISFDLRKENPPPSHTISAYLETKVSSIHPGERNIWFLKKCFYIREKKKDGWQTGQWWRGHADVDDTDDPVVRGLGDIPEHFLDVYHPCVSWAGNEEEGEIRSAPIWSVDYHLTRQRR